MKPSRQLRGFSLVEVLITIVIAAIILGIGVPSFRNLIINNRIVSQTNEIIGVISIARSEAIRKNTSVSLCRVSANNSSSCAGSSATWDHWIIVTSSGEIIQRGSFNRYGNTINITSSLINDQIRFQSNGLSKTGSGAATVSVNSHRFRVCSTQLISSSKHIVLGTGSRQSVEPNSNGC